MNTIEGIPYREARFDQDGKLLKQDALPAGVTDLYVVSHGWNNNDTEARALYATLFTNFAKLTATWPERKAPRQLCILGILWPSKALDDVVKAAAANPGGAASLPKLDTAAEKTIRLKLAKIEKLFPGKKATFTKVRALIPKLESSKAARDEFVAKMRALLDPAAAHAEDASNVLFKKTGDKILADLSLASPIIGAGGGGGGAAALGAAAGAPLAGGAAGLGDLFSGFKSGAIRFLNYFTYYEMKSRAGTVGADGVAPLLKTLAGSVERIHLIGHSFGGRLVSAAAKADKSGKVASLALLQAAFSHNGFSDSMKGFFRDVVAKARVRGPILITHTANDQAVGLAYPIASRIALQNAAAIGDENDQYGGIGRNGAQKMAAKETSTGKLLAVGGAYALKRGVLHNLEASPFIKDHGDVTGPQVAYAIAVASLRGPTA